MDFSVQGWWKDQAARPRQRLGGEACEGKRDCRRAACQGPPGRRPGGGERQERSPVAAHVRNVIERFLEQYKKRPRTKDEVVRHLRKYAAPLHSMPVDLITLRDVADLLSKLDKSSGSTTANRVRSTLSAVFCWAMREGLALSNPVVNTNKRDEHPRDRVLSNDEIGRILERRRR